MDLIGHAKVVLHHQAVGRLSFTPYDSLALRGAFVRYRRIRAMEFAAGDHADVAALVDSRDESAKESMLLVKSRP